MASILKATDEMDYEMASWRWPIRWKQITSMTTIFICLVTLAVCLAYLSFSNRYEKVTVAVIDGEDGHDLVAKEYTCDIRQVPTGWTS